MGPAEKKDKLLSVMASFSLEMQALGLKFATVMFDDEAQTIGTTTIGFAGNVTMEGADAMFKAFLASRKSPDATIQNRIDLHMPTKTVQ